MSFLTGGSKQKSQSTSQSTSTSGNQAFDFLKNEFSPLTNAATDAYSAIRDLLNGNSSGFDTFKRLAGFNTQAQQGAQGITSNAAARGLLNSGSTGKALVSYGTDLGNQYYQNYLNDLFNQANLGYQAGNLISGAGQYGTSNSTAQSTSKGSSTGGLAALFVKAASAGAAGG